MKQYLQRRLKELDQRLPLPQVLLLPGDLFYCQAFDIPAGTPEGEVAGFARLQLEASAPFPIETLAWGFVRHGLGRLLVYAATRERLEQAGFGGLDGAWHVLPGFVALCGSPSNLAQVRFAATRRSISALFFEEGRTIPHRVVSRPVPAGEDDTLPARLSATRDALGGTLGRSAPPLEPGFWLVESALGEGQDKVTFNVRRFDAGGPVESDAPGSPLSGQQLWDADVRGREFAARTQRQRRQGRYVWIGFGAAAAAVALLVLAQVALWSTRLHTRYLRSVEEDQRPTAELLESKINFANNLERVTEREMKPFSMLAEAATVKPADITFERIEAQDWNVLRVEGYGARADQITRYMDELRGRPKVRELRSVESQSRGGRVSFEFEIAFEPLADLAPLTPRPAEEPAQAAQPAADAPAPEPPQD